MRNALWSAAKAAASTAGYMETKQSILNDIELAETDLSTYFFKTRAGSQNEREFQPSHSVHFIDCDLKGAYFQRFCALDNTDIRHCNLERTNLLLASYQGQYGAAVRQAVTQMHVHDNRNRGLDKAFFTLQDAIVYMQQLHDHHPPAQPLDRSTQHCLIHLIDTGKQLTASPHHHATEAEIEQFNTLSITLAKRYPRLVELAEQQELGAARHLFRDIAPAHTPPLMQAAGIKPPELALPGPRRSAPHSIGPLTDDLPTGAPSTTRSEPGGPESPTHFRDLVRTQSADGKREGAEGVTPDQPARVV